MSKKAKKKKVSEILAEERSEREEERRAVRAARLKRIFLISVFAVIILAIAGTFFYQTYIAPYRQVVLRVDDSTVRMDYFLRRLNLSTQDTSSVIETLVYEEVLKVTAPGLGITATEDEIDDALLYTASSQGSANFTTYLTEPEFKEWYAKELDRSKMSDKQYREYVRTKVIANKLHALLAENMVSVSQQVYLNVIVTNTEAAATGAKQRIEAGETFADVAREVSLDEYSRENGGEIGWIPPGVYTYYDGEIFTLEIGEISTPVPADPYDSASQYVIFMVSDKDTSRKIEDGPMEALKANALNNWLIYEAADHDIEIVYDFNTSANIAWLEYEVNKLSSS